jgi:dihydropteroate synthase
VIQHVYLLQLEKGIKKIDSLRLRGLVKKKLSDVAQRLGCISIRIKELDGESATKIAGEFDKLEGDFHYKPDLSPDLLLFGTRKRFSLLADNLISRGDMTLVTIGRELSGLLANLGSCPTPVELADGRKLEFGERTQIMGVVNVTPDSFSDGGKFFNPGRAIAQGKALAEQGADIIDIGGESTRPGSEPVSVEEEIGRVLPVIEKLVTEISVPISIDTTKAEVARVAVGAGASIVNDISGAKFDPQMAEFVSEKELPIILMHTRDKPAVMQNDTEYNDLMAEVIDYLVRSIERVVAVGVAREKIILDPGIGFGKNLAGNLAIIARLEEIKALGRPVLIGPSRKRFIGDLTGRSESQREFGTAGAVSAAIACGADIIRVHNVGAIADTVKVADAILRRTHSNI